MREKWDVKGKKLVSEEKSPINSPASENDRKVSGKFSNTKSFT